MTERCDLQCRYCRTGLEREPADRALPALGRLAAAVGWAVRRLPVTRVKITGGEPLLRAGLVSFVRALAGEPGVGEISMTTNGSRLSALAAGLAPVKLNAVLRRSTFESDVPALLEFASERGLEVRFIELMRTGPAAAFATDEFVSSREVRERLALGLGCALEPSESGAGPARRLRVRIQGVEVVTGWIEPISHSFCGGCRRLRLDSRGDLRRCLMDPEPLPLLARLEAGDGDGLEEDVDRFLLGRRPPLSFETPRSMAAIGG